MKQSVKAISFSLLTAVIVMISILACRGKTEKVPGNTISVNVHSESAEPTFTPQLFDPVHWSFFATNLGNGKYEVVFQAKIDKGWHLYSQDLEEGGPLPTEFYFQEPDGYTLKGRVNETGHLEEEYVDVFDMTVKQYSNCVAFCQIVEAPAPGAQVKGGINYMACSSGVDGTCTPPLQKSFTIVLPEGDAQTSRCGCGADKQKTNGQKVAEPSDEGKTGTNDPMPGNVVLPVDSDSADVVRPTGMENTPEDTAVVTGGSDPGNVEAAFMDDECGSIEGVTSTNMSLVAIFLAGFLGGFIALLTPCVFPIIPLTVSFFTKSSTTYRKGLSNALLYATSIIVIYVGLGLAITLSVGAQALNDMAANVYFNMAFFVIFVVFAISFFGAFEITLPSSWANKMDSMSSRGGMIGIFFMAFTLSLVSFSCTGPIIGTLLVEAAVQRNILAPALGMTGFALALALPFALFAAFPAWLNALPRSGSWLGTVKVTLGFLELALALKFFSNADMAYHWNLLVRETFIGLWVVIFGLMALYLLGVLNLKKPGWGRMAVGILALAFTIYLVPGLWGAPVDLISGFPPAASYGKDGKQCPHNLNCFHDLEEGMAYAKQHDKPVMLDFTGWTCVNCRRMEEYVWSKPEVLKRLRDEYVIISLYVDDRTALPENEQYYSEITQRTIRTIGDRWSELQVTDYKRSSQPWYVLVDHQRNLLANPKGYTPDSEVYLKFLDEGLCRFNKKTGK